ncbi:MAG: protein kinase [Cyanobacteria bacterium J06635_15]
MTDFCPTLMPQTRFPQQRVAPRLMEQPNFLQTQGHRTLAAIVVTDAVGFSARMSIDEESTLRLIQRDLKLMETSCSRLEGRVLKSTGDGLLMYFASAVQAVRCALEIQRQLAQINQPLPSDKALLHRIGIHLGDVFFSQSDVMGNGVNIAARLQTEAQPGAICISQIVHDVVKSQLNLDAAFLGPLHLKNIQEAVPAYQIQPVQVPPPPPERKSEASEPGQMAAGDKIAGRYIIQRLLGQGGFGRSYLAEDTQRFGELCVLKEFVPAKKSGNAVQKALDLFKREAKTLYQIQHPQVPKFLACFTQAQRLFIVQEYIDGVTYSQLLRRRRKQGEQFSEPEVTQWLKQMLQVVEYLHGLELIHRDISPDNIIFSRDRNLPVLIDFGLVNDAINRIWSKANDEEPGNKAASMVGKFGYSPPEQIRLGQCYPCSDLYALGVTALVLLTGKNPRDLMDRDSLEWRWQSLVTLSPLLKAVLEKLTAQRPKDRYQSAQEVLAVLAAIPTPIEESAEESTVIASPSQMWIVDPDPMFEFAASHTPPAASLLADCPDFINQCRQELAQVIGPMADIIVDDVLQQVPAATPQGFVEALASQLSDADQAHDLTSRLLHSAAKVATSTASIASQGRGSQAVSRQVSSNRHPSTASRSTNSRAPGGGSPSNLNSAFVQRCQDELAHYIGPMATFLIEETLADYPDIDCQHLVQKLAAEIPDDRSALQFQQQLLR